MAACRRDMFLHLMHRSLTRYVHALLVVLVMAGLLAPRMSAVLVELIPGMQTMVICTGDGLITLTIGKDGEPVEVAEADGHLCLMTDTIVVAKAEPQFWQILSQNHDFRFAVLENARVMDDPQARHAPTRGPPVLELI